jgi:hypothetical protein
MKRLLLISTLTLSFLSGTVNADGLKTLHAMKGNSFIAVWKDAENVSKMAQMVNAGHRTWTELEQFASCLIPATEAPEFFMIDSGWTSSTIEIASGDYVGCRGDVENETIYGGK